MHRYDTSQETTPNSISYSRAIARQLKLQEKNLRKLLVGTRLSVGRFISDDSPLSNSDQFQIFRNTLEISNNPAFGLYLGQTLTPTAHGPMGFLANSSPTMFSALKDFSKYLPIRLDFGHLALSPNEDTMECTMTVLYTQDAHVYRMISEAFAVSLLILIERVLGEPFSGSELTFSFEKPDYYEQYQDHINCPVNFNGSENKLILPLSLMDEANVLSDFSTYEYSLNHCKKLLKQISKADDSSHMRVRKLLLSHPNNLLSENDVAEAMFISKRTLARRLGNEGTGFRSVLNEVLSSLAKSYLTETNLSIETIARMLSYHDASSFRRAFKRLHHKTPQEFRKQSQATQGD